MQLMVDIKSKFLDSYDLTNMGRLTSFLNIRATWEETGVRLDHQLNAYVCGTGWDRCQKEPISSNTTGTQADDTGGY